MKKDWGLILLIAACCFLLGLIIGLPVGSKVENARLRQQSEEAMDFFQVGDLKIGFFIAKSVEEEYKEAVENLVEQFSLVAGNALARTEAYGRPEYIEALRQRIADAKRLEDLPSSRPSDRD
ncbi:MAG: hypothetical protein ACOZAL_01825 [Patescibacteria group bacterium]